MELCNSSNTPFTIRSFVLAALLFSAPINSHAQVDPTAHLTHEFATVRGLTLEYFHFGETGPPVVIVQDVHDYFHDPSESFGIEYQRVWIAFLEDLGRTHRVIANVRRGWGESDNPGWGFDVATQAEDLLGLLDALNIDKAVFVGRTAATQDMTWIAEHHPERVLGLGYWNTPMGHLLMPEAPPEVTTFDKMYNRGACDIGQGAEVDMKLDPRSSWLPHFAFDTDSRIDIPAFLMLHPVFDKRDMTLRRIDNLEQWNPEIFGDESGWCDPEAQDYFEALRQNPDAIAHLRKMYEARSNITKTQEAVKRAFGDRMTVMWKSAFSDDMSFAPLAREVRAFTNALGLD